MKLHRSLFRYLLVAVTLCLILTFVACTILDNDLRDLDSSENPAYSGIVHEEGEDYTADYQYQPWTILVDERYKSYIRGIDYEDHVLYLYDYIPEDMLPKEGSALAAKASNILPFGLSYKVLKVLHIDNNYAVVMKRAHTEDIFKYLVFDLNTEYGTQVVDTIDEEGNQTRTMRLTRRSNSEGTRADNSDAPDNYNKEIVPDGTWEFDLIDLGEKIALLGNQAAALKAAIAQSTLANVTGIKGKVHEFHYVPSDKKDWDAFVKAVKETEKGSVPKGSEAVKVKEKEKKDNKSDGDKKDEKVTEKTKGGKTTGGDKSMKEKFEDACHFEANAYLECILSLRPSVKIKIYHNQQEKQFDYSMEICGRYGLDMSIAGSVCIVLDWLKLFGWDKSYEKILTCVAGVPVWFQLNPQLWSSLEFGGSMSYSGSKYFSFGMGYRDGFGKDDGIYGINNSKPLSIKDNDKWNLSEDDKAKLGFSSELHLTFDAIKFTPQMILGLGVPPTSMMKADNGGAFDLVPEKMKDTVKELVEKMLGDSDEDLGLNVKLEWDPYISVRLSLNAASAIKRTGQGHFHFCVPISMQDGFIVLSPWPGYEFRWNVLKDLLSLFGDDTGYWEFFAYDWLKYPAVDDVSIVCTNPDAESTHPRFSISFRISDLGLGYEGKKGQWSCPVVYVYDKDDKEKKNPLFRKELDFLTIKDLDRTLSCDVSNSAMKRDHEYILEIRMMVWNGSQFTDTQYFEEHIFSSSSPSAHITMDDQTYWTASYWETELSRNGGTEWWKKKEPDNVDAKKYGFKFRTVVQIVAPEDVEELGFYVGPKGKKYVADGKVYGKVANAKWSIPEDKMSKRSFEITPYVKVRNKSIIQRWHTPYVVDLDYYGKARDPNWGGIGIPYKMLDHNTYVQYGKDDVKSFERDYDVNVKEVNKTRGISRGTLVGEENGIPTYEFTINPEDLE